MFIFLLAQKNEPKKGRHQIIARFYAHFTCHIQRQYTFYQITMYCCRWLNASIKATCAQLPRIWWTSPHLFLFEANTLSIIYLKPKK